MSCNSRRAFLQGGACGLFTLAALGLAADATLLPVTLIAGSGEGNERSFRALPAADGVIIDRKTQVILVRYRRQQVYAMAMACPHEQAGVKWVKKDGRFQCTTRLAVQA